jgi:hypothetical protein
MRYMSSDIMAVLFHKSEGKVESSAQSACHGVTLGKHRIATFIAKWTGESIVIDCV